MALPGILLTIYAWFYFSIFCHETGHLVFARIGGMSPYLVKIGIGPKLLKTHLFNTVFEFNLVPLGGITHAHYTSIERIKSQLLPFMVGGVLVNSILLVLLLKIHSLTHSSILLIPLVIEGFMLVCNLIPMEDKLYGKPHPNDGKQIITVLTTNYEKLFRNLIEEYKKSLRRYELTDVQLSKTFLNNDVMALQVFINASFELNHRNFDEAIRLFEEVLNYKKITDQEKAFILDHLVSIVVVNGYKQSLDQADIWSQQALTIAPHSKTLQGSRGAVLIEQGKFQEGKELLMPLTEPGNDAIDIAISSCYIAKANHFLGQKNCVEEWLEKASENNIFPDFFNRIQQELI